MEHLQRNQVLELSAVSGVVYVIIDDQRYCHGFNGYVKVWLEVNGRIDTGANNEAARRMVNNYSKSDVLSVGNDRPLYVDFEGSYSTNSSHENPFEFKSHCANISSCKSTIETQDDNDNERLVSEREITLPKACKSLEKDRSKMGAKSTTATKFPVPATEGKCNDYVTIVDEQGARSARDKESIERNKGEKSGESGSDINVKDRIYCEYCSKYFLNQQEFYNHRKSKMEEHSCEICQKIFPFKAHLLVHMHSHRKGLRKDASSNETSLSCELCGVIMSSNVTYKTHMMQHTGESAYRCCVCLKDFNSIGRFSYHLTTHSRVSKVFCKICKVGFENRTELCKHQLTHRYRCSLCSSVFPNKTSRHFHYKLSHADNILKCPQCDKLYSSNSELQLHIKYHQNRQKTQCTICGRLVSRLKDHMTSHFNHKSQEAPYVCDQCPKQFKNKLSFQRHLRTHSNEKPYACTHCPKRFGRSTSLSRHMITHTQQKPFVCSICGKACTQMCNLKSHMQIHKESSGFQICKVCGSAFSDISSLQKHSKSAHAP